MAGPLDAMASVDQILNNETVKIEPEQNIGQRIVGGISDAYDYVSGESRMEQDLPELPGRFEKFMPGVGMMFANMSLARDDKGKLDIFKRFYPDAPARTDKFDNVIVQLDGSEYFLNKPGPSGQDASDALVSTFYELQGARLGGPLRKVGGKIGEAIGTFTGLGGASVAQDLTAQRAGSKQGIDPISAGLVATTGTAAQALAPVIAKMGKPLRNLYRKITGQERFFVNGKFTPEGEKAMLAAGVNTDDISDDLGLYFATEGKKLIDPQMTKGEFDQAVRFGEAQTLNPPIPMSKGDITRTASDQMYEDQLSKGSFGEAAQARMQGFRANQDQALQQNLVNFGEGVMPGQSSMGPVQTELVRKSDELDKVIDRAYENARATGAGVKPSDLAPLGFQLDEGVGALVEASRSASQRLDAFRNLINRQDNQELLVKSLFDWRAQTNQVLRASDRDVDVSALKALKENFDMQLQRLVEKDLINGDLDSVSIWRDAIKNRAEYAKRFESDKFIESAILKEDTGELKYAPSELAGLLLNTGVNFKNSGGALRRTVVKLKKELGANSPEFLQIKKAIAERIIESGLKRSDLPGSDASSQMISGAGLANAIDKVFKETPELMNEVFTKTQISQLQQIKRVALNLTTPVKGGANFSNTASALMVNLQKFREGLSRVLSSAAMKNLQGGIRAEIATGGMTGRTPKVDLNPPIGGLLNIGDQPPQ